VTWAANERLGQLREAERLAEGGAWEAAHDALVRAWRAGPHPRVMELLERAGARVARKGVTARRVSELESTWLALAEAEGASALDALTATPWPRLPRAAKARVATLGRLGPDARITRAFVDLVRAELYPSNAGDVVQREVLRWLLRWKDPMFGVLVERLRERLADRFDYRRLLAQPAPPSLPLSPEEAEALAALAGRLESVRPAERAQLDALWAAVWERPADDGPRAVLADALNEVADVRGEFIALQLLPRPTAKQKQREAALLRAHGLEWLGPLRPFVARGPPPPGLFQRGFPTQVRLAEAPTAGSFEHPAWATVEELSLPHDASFEWRPTLRALKGVHRLLPARHQALLPPLERATLACPATARLADFPLSVVRGLALASNEFGWGDVRALIAGLLASAESAPWFSTVRTLRIPAAMASALPWAQGLLRKTPALERVELGYNWWMPDAEWGWGCALARDGTLEVEWLGRNYSGPPPEELAQALARVDRAGLSSISIRRRAKLTAEEAGRVRKAVERALTGFQGALDIAL
jgi:uncharacterized protein (TIGR02996 family)